MPKKKVKSSLGRTLMNKIEKKWVAPEYIQEAKIVHVQEAPEPKKTQLLSIIDQNPLNDFLQIAELQDRNFQALRDTKMVASSCDESCDEEHHHNHKNNKEDIDKDEKQVIIDASKY